MVTRTYKLELNAGRATGQIKNKHGYSFIF